MLIKQLDKTYSLKNKTLGGVATFLCNGKTVKVNLNLVNIDRRKAGKWSVVADFGNSGFIYPLCQEKELPITSIAQASLIITADDIAAAFADTSGKPNEELMKKFSLGGFAKKDNIDMKENINLKSNNNIFEQAEKVNPNTEKKTGIKDIFTDQKSTEYEKFILSSDNYYLSDYNDEKTFDEKISSKSDNEQKHFDATVFSWQTNGEGKAKEIFKKPSHKNAVKEYADVFTENAGKSGFYTAVKKEIATLFDSFPVYIELTEKIKNSVWTRIEGKNGRYFVLGLVLLEGMPKYICYALPAKQGMFSAKSKYLKTGSGYQIITQDAETGLIEENAEFLRSLI